MPRLRKAIFAYRENPDIAEASTYADIEEFNWDDTVQFYLRNETRGRDDGYRRDYVVCDTGYRKKGEMSELWNPARTRCELLCDVWGSPSRLYQLIRYLPPPPLRSSPRFRRELLRDVRKAHRGRMRRRCSRLGEP